MKLLSILLLIISSSLFAQSKKLDGKGGGNGQLVVIPKGHTKPVPYEAVRAFETGKYRNFYKLPCVNGNLERRSRFDRDYGCHAVEWLNIVKNISNNLYKSLIRAAKTTHFRIINDYIQWEHEPYPNGELDYKKYEKAAFYNGEIILSTPVMDRVGPLENVLTKKQNQGYIVFHELINAAFPKESVTWKLNLGEVFIQMLIFRHPKREVLINLALMDVRMVSELESKTELLDILKESVDFEKDYSQLKKMKDMIFILEKYLLTGKSYSEAYKAYLKTQELSDAYDVAYQTKHFLSTTVNSGLVKIDMNKVFTTDMYRYLMKTYKIEFESLRLLSREYTTNFKEVTLPLKNEYNAQQVIKRIRSLKSNYQASQFHIANILASYYLDYYKGVKCSKDECRIPGHRYLDRHSWLLDAERRWIHENFLKEFNREYQKVISELVKETNFDEEKTKQLIKWKLAPNTTHFPLRRNTMIGYIVDTATQNEIWNGAFKKIKKGNKNSFKLKTKSKNGFMTYDLSEDFVVYKRRK